MIDDRSANEWRPLGEVLAKRKAGRSSRLRQIEILIVEDNSSDIDLLRTAFSSWYSEVRLSFVEDGEQALDWLFRVGQYKKAVRPDFILLDLNLPKKDGLEVLSVIKGDADLQQIPVVVLTTSNRNEDVSAAYKTHANCYLTKTADVFEFFSKIEALEEFWLTVVRLPTDNQAF